MPIESLEDSPYWIRAQILDLIDLITVNNRKCGEDQEHYKIMFRFLRMELKDLITRFDVVTDEGSIIP